MLRGGQLGSRLHQRRQSRRWRRPLDTRQLAFECWFFFEVLMHRGVPLRASYELKAGARNATCCGSILATVKEATMEAPERLQVGALFSEFTSDSVYLR
jgi:hypothetical protein